MLKEASYSEIYIACGLSSHSFYPHLFPDVL